MTMTEREYVQAIRRAAENYRRAIARVETGDTRGFNKSVSQWDDVKARLSISTAIALCDAWLEKHPEESSS